MSTPDTNAEYLSDIRAQRGLQIAQKQGKRVRHITGETYFCPSSAGGAAGYVVDVSAGSCTCADAETSQRCKHQWAVLITKRDVVVPGGLKVDERRQTYKQKDWGAYTRAQETEKATVQSLLRTLCDGIPQPVGPRRRGNQPLALTDLVFAATMKVYTTVSGRRATTDILACERDGFIGHAPTHSSIAKFLENPGVTPLLTRLVEESASPLIAVERDFAADATGFSSSFYGEWFQHKYGQEPQGTERRIHQWVKAHAMVGVATHVITSVKVTAGSENDSPHFKGLLSATKAGGFDMREVSADKAYLSNDNLAAIEAAGASALIPMKVNSTPGSTAAWQRLFHFFSFQREEFLAAYHKRSNVESAFSSVKRKFGASVRSKLPAAQFNEVLVKCLCHNLSMLGHAIGEFNVDPKFWTPRTATPVTEVAS
jgi:transposase